MHRVDNLYITIFFSYSIYSIKYIFYWPAPIFSSMAWLREAMLDVEQGADMVMVKPAGPYLDVLADVAAASPVPVAAYQVSGYSDRKSVV